jgi:membrane associated rhomboid family serine protease
MMRLRSTKAPATLGLIIAIVVCFLASWVTQDSGVFQWLAFNSNTFGIQPWTALTYPFAMASSGVLSILFGCWWLWSFGQQVESDMRSGPFLVGFFVFALLGSASAALAGMAANGATLYGSILPASAITMIWGARNSYHMICFWGINIQAKPFCLLTAVIAILIIGSSNSPIVGLACGLPMALAWAWASDMLPIRYRRGVAVKDGMRRVSKDAKREREQFNEYIDDVRDRERKRAEQERLRKMFEDSVSKDE